MATVRYRGVANRDGSGFVVTLPDIPEISVIGETLFEAVDRAEIALKKHLKQCVENGEALPLPSLEIAQPDAAQGDSVFAFDVEVPEAPVYVELLLDAKTVNDIDEISPNRSKFLKSAIHQALASFSKGKPKEAAFQAPGAGSGVNNSCSQDSNIRETGASEHLGDVHCVI